MKKIGFLGLFFLFSCGEKSETKALRPSYFEQPTSYAEPQVSATGWLSLRHERGAPILGYLKEETHQFSRSMKGKVYTVFDSEFRNQGQISADGRTIRYKKNRHEGNLEPEELGTFSLLEGTAILLDLTSEDLEELTLARMKAGDVKVN